MDIRITPSVLHGKLDIPASKSCAHRALICAALASGTSEITGVNMSKDIEATISAMSALGAGFTVNGGDIAVRGIEKLPDDICDIFCNESGSTLRFVMPVAAALGAEAVFSGKGRLPERPIDIYKRELSRHNVKFVTDTMPYHLSGRLTGGKFEVEGNVSSQFITGLLFALPLADGDSEIVLTSRLESRPYVDITIDLLSRFGITICETPDGFRIPGNQQYTPNNERIEGDYSQAAFFCVANALGSKVEIGNLNKKSAQGDKKILEIIEKTCYNKKVKGFQADCSDIPDLVPILTVLAAFGTERSVIFNAQRLRIKESDRLATSAAMINALGGNAQVTDDGIIIDPCGGRLQGGIVDGAGDHRIVMAAAVAALRCEGEVIIKGAEAAEKSYPDFFKDYSNLGGHANVINLE